MVGIRLLDDEQLALAGGISYAIGCGELADHRGTVASTRVVDEETAIGGVVGMKRKAEQTSLALEDHVIT